MVETPQLPGTVFKKLPALVATFGGLGKRKSGNQGGGCTLNVIFQSLVPLSFLRVRVWCMHVVHACHASSPKFQEDSRHS